jgi:hypothetical protein
LGDDAWPRVRRLLATAMAKLKFDGRVIATGGFHGDDMVEGGAQFLDFGQAQDTAIAQVPIFLEKLTLFGSDHRRLPL